jgi:HEAT repeat protein
LERRLIGVLRTESTDLARDYACRQLALVGSDDAVDTLAGLLNHPRQAYMARYAIEAIGTQAARKALRDAISKTEGLQKAGLVISLGRLADSESVVILIPLLDSPDANVLEATVIALGRIGTQNAFDALRQFHVRAAERIRPIVENAELQAAERLLLGGSRDAALKAYTELSSCTSAKVQLAAYRGLILSQPEQAAALILAGLADEDGGKRAVAADCIISLRHPEDIDVIADAAVDLPVPGRVAALHALQDRTEDSVRRAALAGLDSKDAVVRKASLRVLVSAATSEDVPRLAAIMGGDLNLEIQEAAFETLRLMRHPETEAGILALLSDEEARTPRLLRAAFSRRSPAFASVFLAAAESSDAAVRRAALEALEVMAPPEQAEALVSLLAKSTPGEEREAAGRAVWMACEKIADPAARSEPLFAGYEKADSVGRAAILPSIARIGGDKALATVHAAMKSDDQGLRDAGYRALANWPDASVAEELFDIAKNSENEAYRIWTLRAYARVVSLPDAFSPEKAFEMLKSAMDLAKRDEDRCLIVTRLAAVRTPGSLELLLSYLDDPALKEGAVEAVFLSAKGLSQSHPDIAEPALRKVRELTKDEAVLQQTDKVLRDIEARKQNPTQ